LLAHDDGGGGEGSGEGRGEGVGDRDAERCVMGPREGGAERGRGGTGATLGLGAFGGTNRAPRLANKLARVCSCARKANDEAARKNRPRRSALGVSRAASSASREASCQHARAVAR
jgi:hypothetical protein